MAQYVRFEIGTKRFAIASSTVQEAVRAVAISALPKAPGIVEGAINVRGTVAVVLDIRRRFGLPHRELDPAQHMIVARARGRLVAIRVDETLDLVDVPEEAIVAAEQVVPGAEYVSGIARLADGLLVIHDLGAFLSNEEARGLEAALR